MRTARAAGVAAAGVAIWLTAGTAALAASPSDARQAFRVPATISISARGVARVPTVYRWTPGSSPLGAACCTNDVYDPTGNETTTAADRLRGAPFVLDPVSGSYENCGFWVDSYDADGVYVGSAYSEAPTFCLYVGAIQDDDAGNPPVYSGAWHGQANAADWGGHTTYSTAAGASATVTCLCRSAEWVTTTGPGHGSARVYIDGRLVATVSTYAPATHHRRVVFHYELPSLASFSTLTIVNAGTAGHSRVDLDAVVEASED